MDWSLVWIGTGGGVAVQLLSLAELANVPKPERPDIKDPLFWLAFAIYPLLGGFLTYVYVATPGFDIKPVLALQIGASAPLILRAMASAIPRQIGPKSSN